MNTVLHHMATGLATTTKSTITLKISAGPPASLDEQRGLMHQGLALIALAEGELDFAMEAARRHSNPFFFSYVAELFECLRHDLPVEAMEPAARAFWQKYEDIVKNTKLLDILDTFHAMYPVPALEDKAEHEKALEENWGDFAAAVRLATPDRKVR